MSRATDEETRDPEAVLRRAAGKLGDEWPVWHPGDGTQYRVKLIRIMGGPDHADQVLLVTCDGRTVAVQFSSPVIAAYRVVPWSKKRWDREGLNPPGRYDWWPQVIKPLLRAAGVVKS